MNLSFWIPLILLPIAGGLVFGLRFRRNERRDAALSDVCAQHIYLFHGGHLSESAVQSSRVQIEHLLTRREFARVESSLRPGRDYAVKVRALTEINTESARSILERQVERPLGGDPLERAWYLLDLACGLRRMNRTQSLPVLVRAAAGPEGPLTHFLAAEVACFNGFPEFLHEAPAALAHSALVVLLRGVRGLRNGVEPRFIARARLGEVVEQFWEHRLDGFDPVTVRFFAEIRRLLQRTQHSERWFGDDQVGCENFRKQVGRIQALSDGIDEFLSEAADELLEQLPGALHQMQSEILLALTDLRADVAHAVIPLFDSNRIASPDTAIDSLANSRDESVGRWLCDLYRRRFRSQRIPAQPESLHRSILRVLRRHPSAESEAILIEAATSRNRDLSLAGLGGLGWWVPIRQAEVVDQLLKGRYDRSPDMRVAAGSALARLGERRALRWFRQQLAGEQPDRIHQVIQIVADQGITLLWPDLDCLADADDPNIAFHASEALEQLREEFNRPAPIR